MTEPGKRGGGFRPGSAADQVVKKRARRLLASREEGPMADQLRPWRTPMAPPISTVGHVEAIFDQLAAIFRERGTSNRALSHEALEYGGYTLHVMLASAVGPFEQISGPGLCVYRRPKKAPPKFGWLERIDIRTGSPTKMLDLVAELRELIK